MDNKVVLGSECKIGIRIQPLGELHAENYDFTVKFYTFKYKCVELTKSQLIKKDADTYIAPIDTRGFFFKGRLKAEITAYIPDIDFSDRLRTEVSIITTDIRIV